MSSTYRLILDTLPMTFTLEEGTKVEMLKEHKKWASKLQKEKWVKLPSETPALLNTNLIIALRVVEMTAAMLQVEQKMNDPRTSNFLNKATNFGTDLVDQGYK